MFFKPFQLGKESLTDLELEEDKKNCEKIGPCGIGKKALYLNSFYIDRMYYIPMSSITRIFKRVAMSKGGFTGKGLFGSIPYLVVEYEGGQQFKQCTFKQEEDVDRILAHIEKNFPEIPTMSLAATRKLKEKEAWLARKAMNQNTCPEALRTLEVLGAAQGYLKENPDLYLDLSQAAKKKRVNERSNPAYKWVALAIVIFGFIAFIYGLYILITHGSFGLYFLLFGLAAIFLFSGANVLPTAKNNKRYIEKQLENSIKAMESYIKAYPGFPVPAYYAHPVVLKRMEEIIKSKRANNVSQALNLLKKDLKSLNSSVVVEQEEYDEIMAIKPMFLVMDYQ